MSNAALLTGGLIGGGLSVGAPASAATCAIAPIGGPGPVVEVIPALDWRELLALGALLAALGTAWVRRG